MNYLMLILPTINRLTVGGEKDVQYAANRQTVCSEMIYLTQKI